jgi:ADP-heptose:LPS heptosyltransferase
MIIISPYAKAMPNGQENPKNYPYWEEVISKIEEPIVQIGVQGEKQLVRDFRKNLSLPQLAALVRECKTWISVDSFFQHFCWDLNKQGIVIFSQSDPLIFGHKENINLLKDRKYLRPDQFWLWTQAKYNIDAYITPEEVCKALDNLLS